MNAIDIRRPPVVGIDMRRATSWPQLGISRYARSLLRAMTAERPSDLDLRPLDLCDSPHWTELDVIRVGSGRGVTHRLRQEQIHMLAASRGLDVLHLPWSEGPLRPACRLVLNLHDLSTIELARGHRARFRAYYNTLLRAHVRQAACIIVPSQVTLDAARARWPNKNYVLVPYGVDAVFCHSAPAVAEREPLVLYTGGFDPRKRVGDLLAAFEDIAAAEPSSRLTISGNAPADLRRAVARHPAAHRITLTGYVTDEALAELYAKARVLVYPSELEGFGFPMLEAFGAGTPVVASNTGSLPELADHAALLVGPRAPRRLAEAVLDVLRDDRLATELSKAGRHRVELYGWRRVAQRTLDVYRSVLD